MDPSDVAAHHRPAVTAGAECWRCPLHACGAGPVPPTLPPDGPIDLLVVAEAPGGAEVDRGQTLIGPSGREVRGALQEGGADPDAVSYTNAILCRPPGDLEDFERWCKKNKKPSPLECCRPRLKRELGRARFAIYIGGASVRAAGVGESVMKLRGTPVRLTVSDKDPELYASAMFRELDGLATLHPAFVMRDSGRVMRKVFWFDIAKAVRLARGFNTWKAPSYTLLEAWNVGAAIDRLISIRPTYLAVDTETDGIDPWTCGLRRIGFGTDQEVLIYAPKSVHGTYLMPTSDRERIEKNIHDLFAAPAPFAFHNFFGYDSIVLAQHGMSVNEKYVFDSLVGHKIGPTSELPHGLDFLGSMYTDAPRWKDDVKHSAVRDDSVLDRYLSFDVAVTYVSAPRVQESISVSGQVDIYNLDAELSKVGRAMSALGVRINHAKRFEFARKYQTKADQLEAMFLADAGNDSKTGEPVNPRSPQQIVRLLHERLGLPVLDDHRTDAGEPSTAEPVLLEMLARGVDDRARRLIQNLLGFREAEKVVSTFTGRPQPDGSIIGGPPVHRDGRLRTTWKTGMASGRWSSGDPTNLQNIPDELREMFEGCFVAADYSALELRILAYLSSDPILIKAFDEFDRNVGPDIHVVNACGLFGCTPDKVNKEVRTFAKRFVYGLSYGALPPKIFQTMSLLRNDDLTPVFPGLTLSDVEHAYRVWWQLHPEIRQHEKRLIMGWRKNGYIATQWHGRKRFFIGGENHEEMKNHPIQGAAADLQNRAVLTLTTSYPFDYARSRGLILQVHDQLVVECGEDETERVGRLIHEAMATVIGPVRFPAEVKTGRNWKAVS